MYFLLRDAADFHIARIHRDVGEVVEVAEDAYLAETGHASDETKFDVAVLCLHHRVESLHLAAVVILQFRVTDGIEQWFVVLVNKDDNLPACLIAGTFNDSFSES